MNNSTPKTAEAPTVTEADKAVARTWAEETITIAPHGVEIATNSLSLVIATYREEQVAAAVAEYKRVLGEAEAALKMLTAWREAIELTDAGLYIGGIFHAFSNANDALAAIAKLKQGE